MKSNYFLIIILSVLFLSCNQNKTENIKIVIHSDSIVNTMQGGFGASMHAIEDSLPVLTDNGKYRSWGGSVWGGNPVADDTIRWEAIYQHADWLGFDWCRVEIDHGMYEPEKGKFTFENKEMKILYRWMDYCQSREVDVYFTEMWPDAKWLVHKNFLGDAVTELRSAPNDFEAWAHGFSKLLEFLIIDKKYSCIKWISVNNEPHEPWSWWKAADGKPQDILAGLQVMKQQIDRLKLPVKLVSTDGPVHYEIKDFDKYLPYIGAIAFHDYSSNYDWWKQIPYISHTADAISNWKAYGKKNGNLPVFMAEFGSMMFGFEKDTDGPSRWLSILHDIQSAMRYSNAGIDGMNRWSFTNRGDLDGQWQMIDTWDKTTHQLKDTILPHPNSYYLYGLLTRFTSKYANVIHTEVVGENDTMTFLRMDHSKDNVKHIFATTFQSPENKNISLFITNDAEIEKDVEIDLSSLNQQKLYLYEVGQEAKDKAHFDIKPLKEISNHSISLILKPLSVAVISGFKLEMKDKGIIKD